jgi:transcriptional regulator with XRE-family HTH domain
VAVDPLVAAGRQLRQRREERQLSLRQLALETRISTPVLEALERGWRDRLPEATYLRTMLPLIERHLELAPGSLEVVLPETTTPSPGPQRQGLLRRFTPGSIDVFTTWQGTVLYGLLTLGLIYGLNLQQQHLAQEGLLTLRPVAPLPPEEQSRRPEAGQALLAIEPDLRPLQVAARGQGLKLLNGPSGGPGGGQGGGSNQASPAPQEGTLVLQLGGVSEVNLDRGNGESTRFRTSGGRLEFGLTTPWSLRLNPAPTAAGAVQWRGQSLAPEAGEPGRFRPPAAQPR